MIGPDQQDVGAQQGDEPADRRAGRATGSCEAADTIWLSSPMTGPPLDRVGRRRRHSPSAELGPAIQSTRRVEPDDRHRAAAVGALGRDDAIADAGERPPAGQLAGQGRQVGRVVGHLAEQRAERRRARRRWSPSGDRAGWTSGKADRLAGPAVPPTMTSRPPPATQPRNAVELLRGEARRIGVLPDQAVEGAPGLDPRRQVGDGRGRP